MPIKKELNETFQPERTMKECIRAGNYLFVPIRASESRTDINRGRWPTDRINAKPDTFAVPGQLRLGVFRARLSGNAHHMLENRAQRFATRQQVAQFAFDNNLELSVEQVMLWAD